MPPSTTSATTTPEISVTMSWATVQPHRMCEENHADILWGLLGVLFIALIISMAFNWRFYRQRRMSATENASRVEMRPLLQAQEMADRGILNMAYEGEEAFVWIWEKNNGQLLFNEQLLFLFGYCSSVFLSIYVTRENCMANWKRQMVNHFTYEEKEREKERNRQTGKQRSRERQTDREREKGETVCDKVACATRNSQLINPLGAWLNP